MLHLRFADDRSDRPLWLVLAAALLLTAATIGGVGWTMTLARAEADLLPFSLDAPPTRALRDSINLSDGRAVEQTIPAPTDRMNALRLGLTNLRRAGHGAVVTVSIRDGAGAPLGRTAAFVGDVAEHDVTRLPLSARLPKGAPVTVSVTTVGVPRPRALSLWYERDATEHPETSLRIFRPDAPPGAAPGNLRLDIEEAQDRGALWATFRSRRFARVLLGSVLVVFLLALTPLRGHVRSLLATPRPIPWVSPPLREELLRGLVGLFLAVGLTLPLYQSLGKLPAYGDTNRAFVYHAVARESFLRDRVVGQWEPYLCGGLPLLGNSETTHVSPFFLPVLALGEDLGLRLTVTLTTALGFWGAASFARRALGVSPLPSLLGGAPYALGGFFPWWLSGGGYALFPLAIIPWFLLALWGSVRDRRWLPLAALAAALLALGGGAHTLVYGLLSGGALALFLSLLLKSARPLFLLLAALLLAIPVTAVKLLPVAEVAAVTREEFHRPPAAVLPARLAPRMLLARDQYASPAWTRDLRGGRYPPESTPPGDTPGWREYETYAGILPVLLALAGVVIALRRRAHAAVVGAGGVFFSMTFGGPPWQWLQRLPFLEEILRSPARARMLVGLFVGLLAAFGLHALLQRVRRPALRRVLALAVVAVVVADLLTLHTPLFRRTYTLADPQLPPRASFTRLRDAYTRHAGGYHRVGAANFRAGEGTTDLCLQNFDHRPPATRAADTTDPRRPYRGEAFLTGGGEASLLALAGNQLSVRLRPSAPGLLVVNQNFFPGWRANPPRPVTAWDGAVAIAVRADDRALVLGYEPLSYPIARVLSLAGILFLLLLTLTLIRQTNRA